MKDGEIKGYLIPKGWCVLTHFRSVHLTKITMTLLTNSTLGGDRDLSYNKGLTGSVTPAIGNLRKLRNLYLNSNGFTGRIPPSIGMQMYRLGRTK
nr:3-epi-6-deoxocathasterone 23-monooxygenase [Tanacetum cinerariifolium]